MALKLSAPLEKEFILEKTDKEFKVEDGHTTVTIRQATQGQHEIRTAMYNDFERVFDGDSLKVSQHFSPEEFKRKEVELTLTGCNILGENDKPLFIFRNGIVDPISFKKGWADLPPMIADEIHDKVLEMNPLWSPSGEA